MPRTPAGFFLLPHLATLRGRAHHRSTRLAGEGLLKLGQVGQRTDHAVLADGMRIALHHGAGKLRTHRIATKLSPRDEELLIGRDPSTVPTVGCARCEIWKAR